MSWTLWCKYYICCCYKEQKQTKEDSFQSFPTIVQSNTNVIKVGWSSILNFDKQTELYLYS